MVLVVFHWVAEAGRKMFAGALMLLLCAAVCAVLKGNGTTDLLQKQQPADAVHPASAHSSMKARRPVTDSSLVFTSAVRAAALSHVLRLHHWYCLTYAHLHNCCRMHTR